MRIFKFELFRVVGIFLVLLTNASFGQSSGQSPFSLQGIGDISYGDLVHNQLVGGLGVSYYSPYTVNYKNPAALSKNVFTGFAMGISADYRQISVGEESVDNAGGNLDYIALAIPAIAGKWTLGIALLPYSQVNYSVENNSILGSDSIQLRQTFSGDGGLNQANFSTGYQITKNFSLGVSSSFIFGPIDNETEVALFGAQFGSTITETISHSDIIFGAGALYSFEIRQKSFLSIGVDYDFAASINARRTKEAIEGLSNSNGSIPLDTLVISERTSGSIDVPARLTFGATYDRTNRYKVGFEIATQAWDNYVNFEGETNILNNAFRIGVGGEFIPNYQATKGYFNRVTFRGGVNYSQTPFMLNGNDVDEIGINFGLSLPIGRLSSLEIGGQYSRRGNVSDNLIEEEFYKIFLGVSFNDVRWKKRPRFN